MGTTITITREMSRYATSSALTHVRLRPLFAQSPVAVSPTVAPIGADLRGELCLQAGTPAAAVVRFVGRDVVTGDLMNQFVKQHPGSTHLIPPL